jgi:hypothetical protein
MSTARVARARASPYPPQSRATEHPQAQSAARASRQVVRAPRQRELPMDSVSPPHPTTATPQVASSAQVATSTEATGGDTSRASLYRLRFRPLVKKTVNERDTSGDPLDEVTLYGSSFQVIMQRIWDDYRVHVFGIAGKTNGEWTRRDAEFEDRPHVMVLKSKGHHVPRTRQENGWNAWLVRVRQEVEPVSLLIYKYGTMITTGTRCKEFEAKFVPRNPTDRAGATAEVAIADVITQLQERWSGSLRASPVAWRLWATDITSDNESSSWAALVEQAPPAHLAGHFKAPDSRVLQ